MRHLLSSLAVLVLLACDNNAPKPEQTPVLEKRTDGQYYVEVQTGQGGYRNQMFTVTVHTALNCPKITKGVSLRDIERIAKTKEHEDMRSFQYCATCFTASELDSINNLLNQYQ